MEKFLSRFNFRLGKDEMYLDIETHQMMSRTEKCPLMCVWYSPQFVVRSDLNHDT
jgi:hypothetical protein